MGLNRNALNIKPMTPELREVRTQTMLFVFWSLAVNRRQLMQCLFGPSASDQMNFARSSSRAHRAAFARLRISRTSITYAARDIRQGSTETSCSGKNRATASTCFADAFESRTLALSVTPRRSL
jgi:hypothetical protein